MPDGGTRFMAPVGPYQFRAMDGSGYRLDVPSGWPKITGGPNPNLSHTLTDADGTRYSTGPGVYPLVSEDTNGNQITDSGTSITDTMGRAIPSVGSFPVELTYWPSGIGTTDFSGCSGPLPIVGAIVWALPGPNGSSYTLKFCFVLVSEKMPPDQYFANPYYMTSAVQLQSVVLPDATTWTLQYATDGSGNLSQITFPTGGTLSYAWINASEPQAVIPNGIYSPIPFAVATRTLNSNSGSPSSIWQYHYSANWGQTYPSTNTVTDPAGNDTVHTFGPVGNSSIGFRFLETTTKFYQGSAGGGTLLRTNQRDYQVTIATDGVGGIGESVVPIRDTSSWPNGQQTKVEHDYDSGFSVQRGNYDQNGNWTGACSNCGSGLYGTVVATREYDYGSGSPGVLTRTTTMPHFALSNPTYLNNNLLNLLSSQTVTTGGGGTTAASSTFGYDGSTPTTSGILTQHDSNPFSGSARGNLTSVSKWLNTTNSSILSQIKWYDTGTVFQEVDPLGHATTHNYDSAYAGTYLTKTCNALTQCVSATYDFNSGLKTSFTDANAAFQANGTTPGDPNHTTTYAYNAMGRITSATAPPDPNNGGASAVTSFIYATPNTFPFTAREQRSITPTTNDVSTTYFDGLGRAYQTQHATPGGTVVVDTVFDSMGRVASVSNPYYLGSDHTTDPTYGVTQTQYDALGRGTQITRQDGSIAVTSYSDPNTVTVTSEAGQQRRSITDGLGRLIEVDEPTGGFPGNPASGGLTINGTLQSKPATNPTPGTGSVTLNGSEQSKSGVGAHPGTPGTGTISFASNTFGASTQCLPDNSVCDFGTLYLTVNGSGASTPC